MCTTLVMVEHKTHACSVMQMVFSENELEMLLISLCSCRFFHAKRFMFYLLSTRKTISEKRKKLRRFKSTADWILI